jgi:phosphodiesterase/alkaline phosphatase D-like protein
VAVCRRHSLTLTIYLTALFLLCLIRPTTFAETLYVQGDGGGTIATYNPSTGEVINANFITSPGGPFAIFGNNLFVAENGVIAEYNASTGALINASFITGLDGTTGMAVLGNTLYVTDGSSIDTYNANTGSLIQAKFVTGLNDAAGLAIASNSIYVVCSGDFGSSDGTVTAYDATLGTPVATFATITGLDNPVAIAISGNTLFVSNYDYAKDYGNAGSDTVNTYNATTGAQLQSGFVTGLNEPLSLAVSGNTLFVTNLGTSAVNAYDTTTGAAIPGKFITGLPGPTGLSTLNGILYVTDAAGDTAEYNTNNGTVTLINANFFNGLSGSGFVISGNDLFALNYWDGSVVQYNATTGALINAKFITGLQNPTGITISGNNLYVANYASLGEYNATTGATIQTKLIPTLSTGGEPVGIAVLGNNLFVTNFYGNSVDEYDASTGKLIKASFIAGLNQPNGLTLSGNDLFVTNAIGYTVASEQFAVDVTELNATTGSLINYFQGNSAQGSAIWNNTLYVVEPAGDVGSYNAANGIAINDTDFLFMESPKAIAITTANPPPPSNVATLSGLALSTGSLAPAFSSTTTSYSATVSNTTASVTLTPTVTNTSATVTVNGTLVSSGSPSGAINLDVGSNPAIDVVVTAQDGKTTKTYTVAVTRTAVVPTMTTLAAAGVSTMTATLNGTAVANNESTALSFDYGLSTSYGTNVVATPSTASGSTATGMNATLTGLKPGTVYHFRAKGVNGVGTGNGSDAIFTTISNLATLSGFTLSSGSLSPAFNSNTTNYTASVAATITSLTVTPTATAGTVTGITVNGLPVISGKPDAAIPLAPGLNTITIATTAQDGVTTVTYTVVVNRLVIPSITTSPVTNLGTTTATLNGTAVANNESTALSFDYGASTSYGTNVAATPSTASGITATGMSTTLNGLKPGTVYHFRAKGVSSVGTGTGLDATFTTISNVATLSGLTLSSGTLSPTFNGNTTTYTASVAATITSLTVTPTATAGTVTGITVNGSSVISGKPSAAIPLAAGPNTITVSTTAQDSATIDTYTVAVNRLVIPSMTTSSVTNVGTTTVTLNGTAVANNESTALSFDYGTSTSYGTNVIASPSATNGSTSTGMSATLTGLKPGTVYHFRAKGVSSVGTGTGSDATFTTISNVATLSGLTLSSGSLSPAFNSKTTSYTASVATTITSLIVTPTATAGAVTGITVNGSPVISGKPSAAIPLAAGLNTITVSMTAQDGVTTDTYTVVVNRVVVPSMTTSPVTSLGTTTATLNAMAVANNESTALSFDYGTSTSYGTNVIASPSTATGSTSTSMSATLTGLKPGTVYYYRAKGVSVAGTGTAAASFTTVSTVATLSALTLSSGALSPAFTGNTKAYTASVAGTITSLTVTPTATAGPVATITVNGNPATSGKPSAAITLAPGPNNITVTVTAQDGVTIDTYTIVVTRLVPPSMGISPVTNIGTTTATLNGTALANNESTALSFDYGTSTSYGTNVIASPSTAGGSTSTGMSATLSGLKPGTVYFYRAKGVSVAGTGTATGSFTTVSTVATLSSVKLSSGTLSPAFTSTTTTYTETVPDATSALTVTPTATTGLLATIAVNGSPVVSGTVSNSISLNYGANAIAIVVTAQDGVTTKTYNLSVTRLMKPTVTLNPATLPTATSITLNGAVNANGNSTTVSFKYGTSTNYTSTAAATPATVTGSASTGVSAKLTSLIPSTTYDYELLATSTGGTNSATGSFTTPSNVATLSALSLGGGTFSPAFGSSTTSYAATVSSTTTSVTVTPTVTNANATVSVVGVSVTSGSPSAPINLNAGANAIPVVVTAQDHLTTKTYTLTVTRTASGQKPAKPNDSPAYADTVADKSTPAPKVAASSADSTAAAASVTAPVPIKAQLIGPVANGDALPDAQINFTWNAGRGASAYWLVVGSTVGSADFYDSSEGDRLNQMVTVPTDGENVYVTLHSMINGSWQSNNYVFTTKATNSKASIISPAPGQLPGGQVTFTWNSGTGASGYRLTVGSTAGGSDLYDGSQTLALSQAVTIPTNGEAIYVTLGSLINNLWLNNSYVYTVQDTSKAVILTPADQSVLTGAATAFTWNAIPGASDYWLSIGSTDGGADIYSVDQGTALTQTVTLPTDGRELFVTLRTSIHDQWLASDSTLTAAGSAAAPTAPKPASVSAPTPVPNDSNTPPTAPASADPGSAIFNAASPADARILSPSDQSPLSGSPVTFTWDPGSSATEYWLSVGTSAIATDLYNASQGSRHTVTITLPVDGSPLYVTLSSLVNGQWQSSEYFYQAALPK